MVVGGLPAGSRDLGAAREMVRDGLAAMLPHARAAGVPVAIEPLHPVYAADRSCVNTLGQALDLADELGRGGGGGDRRLSRLVGPRARGAADARRAGRADHGASHLRLAGADPRSAERPGDDGGRGGRPASGSGGGSRRRGSTGRRRWRSSPPRTGGSATGTRCCGSASSGSARFARALNWPDSCPSGVRMGCLLDSGEKPASLRACRAPVFSPSPWWSLRSPAQAKDCVVLLHGLGRSGSSFLVMEEMLASAGFKVVNNGYPSTEMTVEDALGYVTDAVEECGDRTGELRHPFDGRDPGAGVAEAEPAGGDGAGGDAGAAEPGVGGGGSVRGPRDLRPG